MALQYVKSFFHYVHCDAEKNDVLEMNHYNYCGQLHYLFKFVFRSYLAEKLLQEILIYIFGFMIRAKIELFHWKLCGKPSRGNANARFIPHEKEHQLAFLWNDFTRVQTHVKVAKPMTKRLFQKIQWFGWIASGCGFQVFIFELRPVWTHLA